MLSPHEQRELLADYLPWAHAISLSGPPPRPVCRDPGDAPFIHLAIAGKARALVSGDKDLLALDGAPGLCPVLTIDAFCSRYLAA